MKRLDGYLSRKAQALYPDALVYCDESGPVQVWTLERPGQGTVGLGDRFRAAHQSIMAMRRAAKK